MINFYKYAERHIHSKLLKAGLCKKELTTPKFQIDYWDTKTDKPCIFLLNGFGANAEFQWFKQVDLLQKHYRVVLINLLYFGNSKATKSSCYDIKCQLDFIESLRSHLNLDQISMAGISYGGLIAIEYTNTYSQNVKKLFLIDAAVKFLTIEHLNKVCENYNADSIEDFFAPKNAAGLMKQLKAAYHKPPFIPSFILSAIHKEMCLPYLENWLGLIGSLRAALDELSQRTYSFNTPTTIFWGLNDEIIPLAIGEKIAKELPVASLHILPKAGHMPNMECTKAFNAAFLEEIEEQNL